MKCKSCGKEINLWKGAVSDGLCLDCYTTKNNLPGRESPVSLPEAISNARAQLLWLRIIAFLLAALLGKAIFG